MIEEIIYTSAPQGLRPGSRGFCTVASTPGMATSLATFLESLSGYRQIAGEERITANPVVYCNLRAKIGGRPLQVLSRVADAGLDYSGRTNKLAHHLAFEPRQLPAAGPAATQQSANLHATSWSGDARTLQLRHSLPVAAGVPTICNYWKQVTGDAGWGGIIGQRLQAEAGRDLWLICESTTDALQLLAESIAIMPPELRWKTTYCTYFTKLPPGIDCRVKFVIDGTPEAMQVRKRYELKAIDLCRPQPSLESNLWTTGAREGAVAAIARPKLTQPQSPSPVSVAAATEPEYEVDLTDFSGSAPPPLPSNNYGVSPINRRKRTVSTGLVVASVALLFIVAGGAAFGWYWATRPGVVASGQSTQSTPSGGEKPSKPENTKPPKPETNGKKNQENESSPDETPPAAVEQSTVEASEQPANPTDSIDTEEGGLGNPATPSPDEPPVTPPPQPPFFSPSQVTFNAFKGAATLSISDPAKVGCILLIPDSKSAKSKPRIHGTLKENDKVIVEIDVPDPPKKEPKIVPLLTFTYKDKLLSVEPDKTLVAGFGNRPAWHETLRFCSVILFNQEKPDEQCVVYPAASQILEPIQLSPESEFPITSGPFSLSESPSPTIELVVQKTCDLGETYTSEWNAGQASAVVPFDKLNQAIVTVYAVLSGAPERRVEYRFHSQFNSNTIDPKLMSRWHKGHAAFLAVLAKKGVTELNYWDCKPVIDAWNIKGTTKELAAKSLNVDKGQVPMVENAYENKDVVKFMEQCPVGLSWRQLDDIMKGVTINIRVRCPLVPVTSPSNVPVLKDRIVASSFSADFPAASE